MSWTTKIQFILHKFRVEIVFFSRVSARLTNFIRCSDVSEIAKFIMFFFSSEHALRPHKIALSETNGRKSIRRMKNSAKIHRWNVRELSTTKSSRKSDRSKSSRLNREQRIPRNLCSNFFFFFSNFSFNEKVSSKLPRMLIWFREFFEFYMWKVTRTSKHSTKVQFPNTWNMPAWNFKF